MNAVSDSLAGQATLLNELLTLAIEPRLAAQGITFAMFELLSAVRSSGGRSTQAEVARRLGITPPSLCEAVKAATRKGLVEQVASADDARCKYLKLTTRGRKALQDVLGAVSEAEQTMLDGLDVEDVERAVEILRAASKNLAKSLHTATPNDG